jgi:hypothetical protein
MTKQTYCPTEAEKNAVFEIEIPSLYDWLQIQHDCEDEEELTPALQRKQQRAIKNAYKGALLIQKAMKDFQFC